jgi:hypothetical protein
MDPARIDAFLSAPCTLTGFDDISWGRWIADTFTLLVDEVDSFSGKHPGCDSGWIWTYGEAVAVYLDPSVATPAGVAEKILACDPEDWEELDRLREELEFDWQRVTAVTRELLRARLVI